MLRGKLLEEIDVLRWTVIELPEGVDVFDAIGVLEKNPLIEKAIPVGTIYTHALPNDPYFRGTSPATYPHQWGLRNTGQSPPGGTSGADIKAEQAWDITTGTPNVLIAILDSGIPLHASNLTLSHPDLNDASKIIIRSDYVNDGQSVRDRNGHGTHVAGIVAAMTNNGEGIAGVAWNCRILVYQVFDSIGSGTWSYFRNAVRDAVDYQRNNPGQRIVVNFSGGGPSASPDAEDAILYANQNGVPIIVSAGNTPGIVSWPARYSLSYSNVIAVAATDHNDNRSSYSGQGQAINIAAPGGYGGSPSADDIFSTTPNYPFYLEKEGVSRTYGYMAGTSMAAPHVAGVVALMLSLNPELTPSQFRQILEQTADDKGSPGRDNDYGHGRINAQRALESVEIAPVISGFTQTPTPIYLGNSGVVTCNLSQGRGNLTYNWTASDFPPGVSVSFQGNTAYISYNYKVMENFSSFEKLKNDGKTTIIAPIPKLTCTVSNSAGSDTKDTWVYLARDYGCPFVYTWNGKVWVEDNNILPQSEYPENYGVDVTDYYQLFTKPMLNDDKYYLAVGEFEQERTFLDRIQLLVVDHSPEASITVDDSGQVIQFLKPLYLIDAQLDSQSVIKKVSELDGIKVEISEGSNMNILFSQDGGDSEQALLLVGQVREAQAKYRVAGRISSKDKLNNLSFTDFRFRRNPSYTWVVVPAVDTSVMQLNIQWSQDVALDYTELSRNLELPFTITEAQLLQAEHSLYGDITSSLSYVDENYTILEPGNWITLEFSAPPVVDDMERSFILISRGRYERIEESGSFGKSKQLAKKSSLSSISEYKLEQNHPNPFNPSTKIKYSIKEPGLVTLKVYDLLGREIATLVNEPKQAGEYEVEFNADSYGLSSGVYLYQLTSGSFISIKKFVLIK